MYFKISHGSRTLRTRPLKPHKTQPSSEARGPGTRQQSFAPTANDSILSEYSVEDTSDLKVLIAFATVIPYSLRETREGENSLRTQTFRHRARGKEENQSDPSFNCNTSTD